MSHSSVCTQAMKFLSISFSFPLSFHLCLHPSAVHPLPPFLSPSTFQNYFPLSIPHFFSLSLPVLGLYVSASPEQTGLLSFTIGPGLEGWQTHKGSASLLGAAKKLKEGIVEAQKASALHQPRKCLQKKTMSACKMSMQTGCCRSITINIYMDPCKLFTSICTSVSLSLLDVLTHIRAGMQQKQ